MNHFLSSRGTPWRSRFPGLLRVLAVTAAGILLFSPSLSLASVSKIIIVPKTTEVSIYWTSSSKEPSSVTYGILSGALIKSANDPIPVSFHSLSFSNLTPNTTYYFHIVESKNDNPSLTFTFRTLGQLTTNNQQLTTGFSFTKNLKLGMTDPEVKQLQLFLNSQGILISQSGPGSKGLETNYFGPATSRAVSKFQELYRNDILVPNGLTKGTGAVLGLTRAKLNQILATTKKNAPVASTQPVIQTPSYYSNAGGGGGYSGSSGSSGSSPSAFPSYSPTPTPSPSGSSPSPSPTPTATPPVAGPNPSPTPSPNPGSPDVALTSQQVNSLFPGNPDNVTAAGYMQYLHTTDSSLTDLTLNGFLVKARQQSAASWDSRFTAAAMNNWAQTQFGFSSERRSVVTYVPTNLKPSADSRIIYVSSSEGNNANDGLSSSSPKADWWGVSNAREATRAGFPDWILLKRGDVWSPPAGHQEFWPLPGRSAQEPAVLWSYGSSSVRPKIIGTAIYSYGQEYNSYVGIHLDRGSLSNPENVGINLSNMKDILIEDMYIEGFEDGIAVQGGSQRIKVRGSVVVDSYNPAGGDFRAQGAFFGGVNNLLIEGSVFDHNGWRESNPIVQSNIYNHNIYINASCQNVITRNNILARSSSHGIQQRPGGLTEDNLFLQNPLGLLSNSSISSQSIIRRNVFIDGGDIERGGPRGNAITVIGGPDDFNNQGTGVFEVYDNIMANNVSGTAPNALFISGNWKDASVRNNILYKWQRGIYLSDIYTATGSSYFTGNIIYDTHDRLVLSALPISSSLIFSGNQWYSTASQNTWFDVGGAGQFGISTWLYQTNQAGGIATGSPLSTPLPSPSPSPNPNPTPSAPSGQPDFITGIVAHYGFDGEANDSVGSHNGTLQSGPIFTSGKIGQALSFDGINDYVVFPTISLGTTYTLSGWFYFPTPTGSDGFKTLIMDNYDSGLAYRVDNGTGNLYAINVGSGQSAGVIPAYGWHHVTLSSSAGAATLYFDGAQIASSLSMPAMDAAHIGGGVEGTFFGLIDEVRIYNRALSSAEVLQLYNASK